MLESFSSKKNCSGNHPNVSDLPMNKNIKSDWLDINNIKYACKLHRTRLGHRGASLIKKNTKKSWENKEGFVRGAHISIRHVPF